MRFFERQRDARRKTALLLLLFAAAVLAVTWLTNRVYVLFLNPRALGSFEGAFGVYLTPTLLTALAIGAGTAWRAWTLRRGGPAVAQLLGGRFVAPETEDPGERQLLNVVEEMALASGVSPPPVYTLDDQPSINAFAAGLSEADGVIAVTRGALEKLDRDELQAVVAHEFSHLLNGDARLNLRLLSVLSGLLAIYAAGKMLARPWQTSEEAGLGRRFGCLFASGYWMMGWAIVAVGSIGVLAARILQAAVSRQREFLADAAAVQFTRNPHGLASALNKIAADSGQAVFDHPHREEVSHMLFVDSLRERAARWFDTHPPLPERIRLITPDLVRRVLRPARSASAARVATAARTAAPARPADPALAATPALAPPSPSAAAPPPAPMPPTRAATPAPTLTPEGVVESVGGLEHARLEFARQLRGRIPASVLQYARRPASAPGVVVGVLLQDEPPTREAQLAALRSRPIGPPAWDPARLASVANETFECVRRDRELLRLPLVELALPALRALGPDARARLVELVRQLIDADRKRTVFEYAALTIVSRTLLERPAAADRVEHRRLEPVRPAIEKVLWLLARTSARTPEQARAAWSAGASRLRISGPPPDGGQAEVRGAEGAALVPEDLPQSLAQLRGLAPFHKKNVLGALTACALADGSMSFGEAEVLRAVAAAIGCPLPPLVVYGEPASEE